MKTLISIIVPCYNEESAVPRFIEAIGKTADAMKEKYNAAFEYIFIDDGSLDNTAQVIKKSALESKRIKYIIFSRNFGKEAAIYAGLEKSRGDYIAIMDADLQDPPEMLFDMYEAVKSGEFDCAAARRVSRKGEPAIRSLCSRFFYRLINKISKTEIADGARDFRLMSRRMADTILKMSEYNRFSKGIFSWTGFSTKWLEYENTKRVAGESKWSFIKLFKYSVDGIVDFSTAPLSLSSLLGLILCLISLIFIICSGIKSIVFGKPFADFSLLLCIIFMLFGISLLCTGIQGQYLAKTYMETKHRPIYISKEDNFDE